MSVEAGLAIVFIMFFALIAIGVPVAFSLGGTAVALTLLLWEPVGLYMTASAVWDQMNALVLVAIPLFIFMGNILRFSGIADDLFDLMYNLFGSLRGGLAIGTIIICTLFAAMTGIVGAAIVTMGLIALPAMLRRGYSSHLAMGSIASGGGLGILIPPSVPFVVYGLMARESIGKLFAGGLTSGLVISALLMLYVGIRCALKPELAPVIAEEQRLSRRQKVRGLRALALPLLIIFAVLGTIFSGVATPTEAAAVGAAATLLVATVIQRKLTWKNLQESCNDTLRITAMVMWIIMAAASFRILVVGLGGMQFVTETIGRLEVNPWLIFAGTQVIIFILGMILETTAIIMITVPIFVPIITGLGFDSVWYGVVFMINLMIGYSTPPFAVNLFYLKGIVPPEISMADIYRSIWPFVGVLLVGLTLVILFPPLATWLPNLLMK